MNNTLEYKGYVSIPRYSAEDGVFWGKLDGITDSISFEGTTVDELICAFKEAVDDYIEVCKRNGMTPKQPFIGQFNVSVSPELHKRLAQYAAYRDVTLNDAVETALSGFLSFAL